jgi:hypothetical protein
MVSGFRRVTRTVAVHDVDEQAESLDLRVVQHVGHRVDRGGGDADCVQFGRQHRSVPGRGLVTPGGNPGAHMVEVDRSLDVPAVVGVGEARCDVGRVRRQSRVALHS